MSASEKRKNFDKMPPIYGGVFPMQRQGQICFCDLFGEQKLDGKRKSFESCKGTTICGGVLFSLFGAHFNVAPREKGNNEYFWTDSQAEYGKCQ